MKELSIEAKAKRYDEAFDRARKLKEDPTSVFYEYSPSEGDTVADYIFPELKESEDEKMLKQLRDFFKNHIDSVYEEIDDNNDVLSWLEKQGEQKPQSKTALEAINEEKVDNANKVELKFKVGDWITNGVYTCKIVEIIDNSYKYTFPEGASYLGVIDDMDKEYHLWTIDDAKAGDILATEDYVFIFKHKDKTWRSLCESYCEVIGNSELGLGFDFSINDVYPASKEQRELLYSKIKKAGYEWDAEKLELKKIKSEFWSDDDNKRFNGFKIERGEVQKADDFYNLPNAYHIFATEKQAKSALAMARISQIMANDVENFGGVITDEEWKNTEKKFVICKSGKRICKMLTIHVNYFLTFHHAKQRDLFLKKYPQLVKDYLMIPEE